MRGRNIVYSFFMIFSASYVGASMHGHHNNKEKSIKNKIDKRSLETQRIDKGFVHVCDGPSTPRVVNSLVFQPYVVHRMAVTPVVSQTTLSDESKSILPIVSWPTLNVIVCVPEADIDTADYNNQICLHTRHTIEEVNAYLCSNNSRYRAATYKIYPKSEASK